MTFVKTMDKYPCLHVYGCIQEYMFKNKKTNTSSKKILTFNANKQKIEPNNIDKISSEKEK